MSAEPGRVEVVVTRFPEWLVKEFPISDGRGIRAEMARGRPGAVLRRQGDGKLIGVSVTSGAPSDARVVRSRCSRRRLDVVNSAVFLALRRQPATGSVS